VRYNHYDFVGQQFGVLKVVDVFPYVSKTGYTKKLLVCDCICGKQTKVAVSDLKKGKVMSCGNKCHICTVSFGVKDRTKKDSNNKVINRFRTCWYDMKTRCDNPKCKEYKNYGGRGIKYQQGWERFENFYRDMFNTYDDSLTLDRIDVNGDYTVENCRWSTWEVQNHNRRGMSGTSQYKGVVWNKSRNKWQASICKGGDQRHLGRFADELAAATAYDNASEELYGDRPNNTVRN